MCEIGTTAPKHLKCNYEKKTKKKKTKCLFGAGQYPSVQRGSAVDRHMYTSDHSYAEQLPNRQSASNVSRGRAVFSECSTYENRKFTFPASFLMALFFVFFTQLPDGSHSCVFLDLYYGRAAVNEIIKKKIKTETRTLQCAVKYFSEMFSPFRALSLE